MQREIAQESRNTGNLTEKCCNFTDDWSDHTKGKMEMVTLAQKSVQGLCDTQNTTTKELEWNEELSEWLGVRVETLVLVGPSQKQKKDGWTKPGNLNSNFCFCRQSWNPPKLTVKDSIEISPLDKGCFHQQWRKEGQPWQPWTLPLPNRKFCLATPTMTAGNSEICTKKQRALGWCLAWCGSLNMPFWGCFGFCRLCVSTWINGRDKGESVEDAAMTDDAWWPFGQKIVHPKTSNNDRWNDSQWRSEEEPTKSSSSSSIKDFCSKKKRETTDPRLSTTTVVLFSTVPLFFVPCHYLPL